MVRVLKEIKRQSGLAIIYPDALLSRAHPVTLNIRNQPLEQALRDPADPHGVHVEAQYDDVEEAWRLAVIRPHFGNLRVSVFDRHFVRGGDYAVLARTAKTFLGLMGEGAVVRRGTGDKLKEKPVSDFREVMQWLRAEAEITGLFKV